MSGGDAGQRRAGGEPAQGAGGQEQEFPGPQLDPGESRRQRERFAGEERAANLLDSRLGEADQAAQHGFGDDLGREFHSGDGSPHDGDLSRTPGAPDLDGEIHRLRRRPGRWGERTERRPQPFRGHVAGELHLVGEEPDVDSGQARLLAEEGGELGGSEERIDLGLRQEDRFRRSPLDLEDLEPRAALQEIAGRRRRLPARRGRPEERSGGEEQEKRTQRTPEF